MTQYTILTGGTGLVGRYLMRDLLLNGEHLALIVRPSRRETAAERVEGICQFWERETGKQLPRPVVLEGDISQPGLGLSDADQSWMANHCRRMIHSAAILEFHGEDREKEPWRTNLYGTQHVLDLLEACGITDLHYVSTAYVAGLQDKPVMEEQLNVGQEFRNAYERSKFEAETLVRECEFLDRPTIYRPAVIAGDYNTGYTNTYHGIYLYLRLIALIVDQIEPDENGFYQTPIKLAMTGREERNIIPVDWVSEAMCGLLDHPESRGRTFHLAPEKPVLASDLIKYLSTYFNTQGAEFCGDDPDFDGTDEADFAKQLVPNMAMYQAYEVTDNTFDLTNLKELLPNLPSPPIDQEVMSRYIKYGEDDKWGKRRPAKPDLSFATESRIRSLASGSGAVVGSVGLNVVGPCGAQWTLHITGDNTLHSIEAGLPLDSDPVLSIASSEFHRLLENGEGAAADLWDGADADEAKKLVEAATAALFSTPVAAPK